MQTVLLRDTTQKAVVTVQDNHAFAEPLNMRKRIGSTVYEVNVYFNQDAKETMNDKIMRLIRNEAAQSGKVAG